MTRIRNLRIDGPTSPLGALADRMLNAVPDGEREGVRAIVALMRPTGQTGAAGGPIHDAMVVQDGFDDPSEVLDAMIMHLEAIARTRGLAVTVTFGPGAQG